MKTLGLLLKRYRILAELEQKDLAKEIGISAGVLSRIERGGLPDLKTYLKIQEWIFKV